MQQKVPCPKCGAPLTVGEKFCSNCGTGLQWPAQQPPPPQYEPPPPPPPPPQYQQPQQNQYWQMPDYSYQNQPPSPPPQPPPAWGLPPQSPPGWGPPPQQPYGMPPYQQPYGQYGYYGPPRKSGSSGLIWIIAIIAFLLLAAGGIGIATKGTFDFASLDSSEESSGSPEATESTGQSTTETSTPPAPAELTATADELITAYKTDEEAADTKYKGKTVTVSGKLESYNLSVFTVTLQGDTNVDYFINCEFKETDSERILSLEPEQSLTISGTLEGLSGGEITLTTCRFVQ